MEKKEITTAVTPDIPATGELLEVESYAELNRALQEGELSQAEYDEIFSHARQCGLMNTPAGKALGKIRPFAMGGSDMGSVRRVSPFRSRRMLQMQKLGLVEEALLPGKRFIYDFGHIFESSIGAMCALQLQRRGLDVVYIPCESGYLNTRWPHFLAHPDGFLVDRKTREIVALAEVKTAASGSSHWTNGFALDIVPEDYVCQVQAYMQVLGIDRTYILAWNCLRSEDGFKQILVERDEDLAVSILDESEIFVAETAAGIEYDDEPLPSELAFIYRDSDEDLGFVKLPRKTQGTLEQLERLAKDKESLGEEVKETNKLIRRIEDEEKKLKSTILPSIGKAPGGILETSKAIYRLEVTHSYSLDKEVKRKAAEEFPEAWEAITGYKPTITSKLTVASREERPVDAN